MVYRALLFFFLLTGCTTDKPITEAPQEVAELLVSNDLVTVIKTPPPAGYDPTICREINTVTERFFAGSAGAVVATFLARTQVQCEVDETAGFDQPYLKVILKPGALVSSDTLVNTLLTAINARLVDLDEASLQVHLRADAIREDIILATSDYTGELTEAASIDSLRAHGIQVTNNTGVPLTMDQETLDFYLPSLHDFFGDSLSAVTFWLEAVPVKRVRLTR